MAGSPGSSSGRRSSDEEREQRLRNSLLRSETMATLMLGCLSLTLAIVMAYATLLGLLGIPTGSLTRRTPS